MAKENMTDLVSYIAHCWGNADPDVMKDIDDFKSYNSFMQQRFVCDEDSDILHKNFDVAYAPTQQMTV